MIHLGMKALRLGDEMVDLARFEDAHYLTVAEVALAMRVSNMTVYRLVHAGELPAVRFGRSYRVPAQAVKEYLGSEQHAADPGHHPPAD